MTQDGIAERARALAGALVESGYARLAVRDGEVEIEVRRRPRRSAAAAPAPGGAPSAQRSADVITSDVVGIVRLGRPAVSVGADLEGDRDLGYVEALGVRNPVRSRGSGRVLEVFVHEGQPVEYGQPLFAIER